MTSSKFKLVLDQLNRKDIYLILLLISELLKFLDDVVFFTDSKELKIIDNIKKQYRKLLSRR